MTKLSRLLSSILRHDARGLEFRPDGYFLLEQVLRVIQSDLQTIQKVVEMDEKNRFSILDESGTLWIRANQGHSGEVGAKMEDSLLLEKISTPLEGCFHGTYQKHEEAIKKEGLKVMKRKHIHFATSIHAKSGKRSDCDLLIYLDMGKAMQDGIIFYQSENGVILTSGKNGVLEPKYLSLNKK